MPVDLPPGVTGPIPDPHVEANKNKNADIVEHFPIGAGPKTWLNPAPLLANYFVFTLHYPAVKLKEFIEGLRSPNKRVYYHEKFNRVPHLWECDTEDKICIYEAEHQFKRDRLVEAAILEIVEKEKKHCIASNPLNQMDACKHKIDEFWRVQKAFHVKYGDMGVYQNARTALNKQKNRFIEKRYKERMGEANEDWITHEFARRETKD